MITKNPARQPGLWFTAAVLSPFTLAIVSAHAADPPAATPAATPNKTMPMMGMGMVPVAGGGHVGGTLGKPIDSVDLTLDTQALTMENLQKMELEYFPQRIVLSKTKPVGVVKEPAYVGTPRYGVVHVGNGPNKDTLVVIDDKDGGGGKLYVDLNRDGDLTNDGDGNWAGSETRDGIIYYKVTQRIVRASWAEALTPDKETTSGPYSLGIYYREGGESAFMYRQTARTGTVTIGGSKVPVLLMENSSDGIFERKMTAAAPGAKPRPGLPVWLAINEGNAAPVAPGVAKQLVDASAPFRIDGKIYEIRVSTDGSKLTLYPSTAKMAPPLPPAPTADVLAAGKIAPDFKVDLAGGGTASLSQFRGKVVIVDFWATWCGPCQRSMPHLEGVYRQIKDGGDAVVMAVCVSDERSAFNKWTAANVGKNYTFPISYDPAGRDPAKEISRNKYGVTGIPTQFIIGKDGKIAASIVGYGGDGDHRLEEVLAKLGIKFATRTASK